MQTPLDVGTGLHSALVVHGWLTVAASPWQKFPGMSSSMNSTGCGGWTSEAGSQMFSGVTSMLQDEVLESAQVPPAPWNSLNFCSTPLPMAEQLPGWPGWLHSEFVKQGLPTTGPVLQVPAP